MLCAEYFGVRAMLNRYLYDVPALVSAFWLSPYGLPPHWAFLPPHKVLRISSEIFDAIRGKIFRPLE